MSSFTIQLDALRKGDWRRATLAVVASLLGALLLIYLILAGQVRIAITVTLAAMLIGLAVTRIQAAMLGALVYLVFMGDLRRLLIPVVGWSETDPLLLIGPAFATVLFGYALASQSVRLDTPLARWTAGLTAVMVLQMFNPQQGSLMVGVAGALFYIVPLLWFWIGRTYATRSFMKTLLFKVVVGLAILAALMGYYQTFFGYLPYQETWYDIAGYVALGSKGIQAPISFFSSSTEYAVFLLIAILGLWTTVLRKKQYAALLLIALLFVAVFLTGIRGPVVKVLFTAAGLWAVLGRNKTTWAMRGALAVLIAVVGLGWGLTQLGEVGGNDRVQHRVQRQQEGLLHATEEGGSASGHLGMMVYGYKRGFQNPLGRGLGSTTKAAAKFGGGGGSTEVDSSDVFVATGVVGGFIYLIMIFLIARTALQYWAHTRSLLALALLGILVVTFLGWLNGGRYAVSPLIWISVGALDRFYRDRFQREEKQ